MSPTVKRDCLLVIIVIPVKEMSVCHSRGDSEAGYLQQTWVCQLSAWFFGWLNLKQSILRKSHVLNCTEQFFLLLLAILCCKRSSKTVFQAILRNLICYNTKEEIKKLVNRENNGIVSNFNVNLLNRRIAAEITASSNKHFCFWQPVANFMVSYWGKKSTMS